MILNENDLRIVERYCNSEYVKKYKGIINRKDNKTVRVVNTGMVSSGKSSLFNVLTDSTETEYFPTGAARTTTLSKFYNYNNIEFIDTPGIDVKTEDDDLAFNTVMESDIIMMIHNIKLGPLNRSEVEWLTKIIESMKDTQMIKSKLIFVCTWKDTREREDNYTNIINHVKEQVYNITNAEISFFDVSVKKYLSGILKHKNFLIESSGILTLRKYLENHVKSYLNIKQNYDKSELYEIIRTIEKELLKQKNENNKVKYEIAKRIKDKYDSKIKSWEEIFNYFSNQRSQLNDLEDELKSISSTSISGIGSFFKF